MQSENLARYLLPFFSIILLLFMSACGPFSAMPTGQTATPTAVSGCGGAGKTHMILNDSAVPAVVGDWPLFRGDVRRDGAAASANGQHENGSQLALAWTFCTGHAVFSSPIVSDGVVYSASTNGLLVALDGRSGRLLWRFRAGGALYSTPALAHGMLYVGALDGAVYAVDATTGKMRWRSAADGAGVRIWSSPVVVNGLVIVGAASDLSEHPKVAGEVLALNAANGARRWRVFTEPDGAQGGGVWSSPAVDTARGVVYVATGDPDDGVQALDMSNGHLLWHWRSVVRDVSDTDVGSGPTLYTDTEGKLRVAVGGKDGNLYSLDAHSGSVLWHTHIGDQVYSSPAFAHGTLYVVGALVRSAVAWAIDAGTGEPRWQHAIPEIVYASPTIAGSLLYLGIGDGFVAQNGGVQVLNASDGTLLHYADLHSSVSSSPTVLSSWLFVGAQDGNLYAFVRR